MFDNGSDGADRNLSIATLVPVAVGAHSIALEGCRVSDTAGSQMIVREPSLSVIFFPKQMVAIFGDGFETGWYQRWSTMAP